MRLALLLLVLGMSLHAASIDLPENFTSHFKQQITNPKGKMIHYRGSVRFTDKTNFKWEYTYPTKKEVCTDGYNVKVVDHDLEQVSFYEISKTFDLSKVLAEAKHYKPSIYLATYEGKQYTIKLDAKKHLSSVAYFDNLDNKVQILFTDMQYGAKKLSKKSMQCEHPKEYDLIRG